MAFQEYMNYLPSWAVYHEEDDKIHVDPDVAYPLFLQIIEKMLPEHKGITKNPTQHAVECARLLFTRYLKKIMYQYKGTPPLMLRIVASKTKQRDAWVNLKLYPVGSPIDRDTIKRAIGIADPLNPRIINIDDLLKEDK